MLDTNTASTIIKGHTPEVRQRLSALPISSIVISAVTQAELARKGRRPVSLG